MAAFKTYQAGAAPAAASQAAPPSPAAPIATQAPAAAPQAPSPARQHAEGRVFASPFAKTLAAERGIDIKVCFL